MQMKHKKKALITGYTGMLGKDVAEILLCRDEIELYGTSRSVDNLINGISNVSVELTDKHTLSEAVKAIQPDIIVHCAAYVDVDGCEKNKEYAYRLNVESTDILASYNPEGTKFIYVSTDSVFDGSKGNYIEYDKVNPTNYYAYTKLMGEKAALTKNKAAIILRTNIYGFHNIKGKSLAEWAIDNFSNGKHIKGFDDIYFNPVYTKQLARFISSIVMSNSDYSGIINIGCNEQISKYKFLVLLAKAFGYDEAMIEPVSSDSIEFIAPRPKNTSLNVNKLEVVFEESLDLEAGLMEFKNDYNKYKFYL